MATYSGEKDDCELPAAQALLEEAAEVLPHARHHRRRPALPKKTTLIATAAGADVFVALKDNQPTLCQVARDQLDSRPAAWTSGMETAHGRIGWRLLEPGLHDSLNQTFLHYADHRPEALRLITKSAPHSP